jgi:hypothetical protein
MSEQTPDFALDTHAATPAAHEIPATPAAAHNGKLTTYTLPDGAIAVMTRPTNRVSRLLMEDPAQNQRQLLDTIAANCLVSLTIPAGYLGDDEAAASTTEFNTKDVKSANFNRLDELSFLDAQTFSVTFERLNSPTKTMVEDLQKAIEQAKSAKK